MFWIERLNNIFSLHGINQSPNFWEDTYDWRHTTEAYAYYGDFESFVEDLYYNNVFVEHMSPDVIVF